MKKIINSTPKTASSKIFQQKKIKSFHITFLCQAFLFLISKLFPLIYYRIFPQNVKGSLLFAWRFFLFELVHKIHANARNRNSKSSQKLTGISHFKNDDNHPKIFASSRLNMNSHISMVCAFMVPSWHQALRFMPSTFHQQKLLNAATTQPSGLNMGSSTSLTPNPF